jgi:hypothetical protein
MRERFRNDYLELLDGRLATIRDHIATAHYEQARIAMLSLEAASGMLGATSLVEPLQELRSVVDVCSAQQRAAMLARVEDEAIRLRRRLQSGEPPHGSGSVL